MFEITIDKVVSCVIIAKYEKNEHLKGTLNHVYNYVEERSC